MDLNDINIVDAVVVLILLVSAILAFSRGLVREVLSIAGWIIAAIAAFSFAPQVEPIIRELPFINQFLQNQCELSILASFVIVFAVTLILVSIFTPLFSGMVSNSALGPLDQGLGFLFGVARGVVLVAVALIVYDIAIGGGTGIPEVAESQTKVLLADFQGQIEAQIPEDAPGWLQSQYNKLTGSCGG